MRSVGGALIPLLYRPGARRWINHLSVTYGQCDVTFPVAGHCCPATGTKLYCLVTEARVCEQLAQGRYLTAAWPGVELATSRVARQRHDHYTTRPHYRLPTASIVRVKLDRFTALE